MEEHVLGITRFVNHLLGPLALSLLHALHITPENAELPIPQHLVMAALVVVIGTVLALLLRPRLSVEKPGASQQIAELLLTNPFGFGIKDCLEENVHHGALKMVPFVGTIAIFVLLSNLFGAMPALGSPTAVVTVPLACAILTFLYFNWQGIKHHGPVGYAKHFAGPVPWLAPLIFPVEIISTTARIVSLTVRLWANIFASDLLYGIFVGLLTSLSLWLTSKSQLLAVAFVLPLTIPIAFIGLHLLVSVIQAYIFTVLPSVYLGMATADEH
ncbi:MAG TPA: F0F1 ATP synthase subunit A [Dongiaceae bacterium]|nr:F0F1 ATP synthase subunit A [Dongiaceae bacterium]